MLLQVRSRQNSVRNLHGNVLPYLPVVVCNLICNVLHRVGSRQLFCEILRFPCLHALNQHSGLLVARNLGRGVVGHAVVVQGSISSRIQLGIERDGCHIAFFTDETHDRGVILDDAGCLDAGVDGVLLGHIIAENFHIKRETAKSICHKMSSLSYFFLSC